MASGPNKTMWAAMNRKTVMHRETVFSRRDVAEETAHAWRAEGCFKRVVCQPFKTGSKSNPVVKFAVRAYA